MPNPLLPPRGLFIVTSLLYSRDLPTSLRETLIQLLGLAWSSRYHETPELSYPQLSRLTGKSIATLRGHIAALRTYRCALRMRRAGSGQFILVFADWLYTPGAAPGASSSSAEISGAAAREAPADSRNLEHHDKNQNHEEEEEEEEELINFLPPPPLNDLIYAPDFRQQPGPKKRRSSPEKEVEQRQGFVSRPRDGSGAAGSPDAAGSSGAAGSPGPAARPAFRSALERSSTPPEDRTPAGDRLDPAVASKLSEAGVFTSLLPEVGRSGRDAKELLALLAWCREDNPDLPGGLFIARLRAGAPVPERFFTKPCPVCGCAGRHAESCRYRYVESWLGKG